MNKIFFLSAILIISLVVEVPGQAPASLKLWYRQPAGDVWENALPIGNGRLGAMIYGNTDAETVQ
ncbi:MAG TPA: glycoside hydrolase N-terminal domain-containing protein, partial [Chitinophagaceae bacterium]|nr:glycoside hydrolase N-terminal domain-containing protein [Chitinophagaceae bacterium]